MSDHKINNKEKAIVKKYSDLEKEQEKWDLKCCFEEGREKYLKECAEMNISLDD